MCDEEFEQQSVYASAFLSKKDHNGNSIKDFNKDWVICKS